MTAGDVPAATLLLAAGVSSTGDGDSSCTVTGNDSSGSITLVTGADKVCGGRGMQIVLCSVTLGRPTLNAQPHSTRKA